MLKDATCTAGCGARTPRLRFDAHTQAREAHNRHSMKMVLVVGHGLDGAEKKDTSRLERRGVIHTIPSFRLS